MKLLQRAATAARAGLVSGLMSGPASRLVNRLAFRVTPGLLSAMLFAQPAAAQIVVGQTADLSGPAAASVAELNAGARLLIDSVNRSGGVHGQAIRLVQLDDRNDPALSPVNARQLIEQHQAQVLFLSRGTPHTQALLPLLERHGIALVAPSTGAMVLRRPPHRLVFNLRASYQREAERAVQHLATLGMRRIAVLRVDDSFGADAAEGALRGFAANGLEPLALETFDRARPDLTPAAARLAAAQAQAVLMIGSASAVVQGVQALRAAGSRAQVLTLSNNASHGFIRLLGPHARGVVVTQVFPSERALDLAVVQQAVTLARAAGLADLSPAAMEGFVSARLLVEALRRAGPRPDRERIASALSGLGRWDLGGLELDYSGGGREGIRHVELSIITADGRFRR